ncbi:Metallothiol transferase FosB [uncultured archaeon]|nr:Metallothiol transferase FosB [uncultured archaeon]
MIKNIRHVGVVVDDVERALSFYRDLLGFEVFWDKVEQGEFVETVLNITSVRVRTIKMRSDNGCVLELLHFGQNPPATKSIRQNGLTHIALSVIDIDQTYSLLKENKIEFLSAPQASPDKKAKVSFCRDFEGNFLELVQELD